jgi:hypothetical protein
LDNSVEKGNPQRPSSQMVGSFTISRFLAHRNTFTYDDYYDCTKKEPVKKAKVATSESEGEGSEGGGGVKGNGQEDEDK